ncbi:MAG: undecaprenyldiphospho-muramoylpentapeptide beta-N-acetylglucosaminyltransferase [Thermacetogeniaceae bacterium]
MRLLITGGGTGGHLYPALAVADLVKEKDPTAEILFVGTKDGLESQVVPKRGYSFREISAVKWPRKLNLQMFSVLKSLLKGYRQGLGIVREFSPDAVFATGGYVSVPLVLAAARRGIPVYLHEQNIIPGLANKLLSRWATAVFVTFPMDKRVFPRYVKVVYSGLPVRKEILLAKREVGLRFFGLKPDLPTVLVTGGSRGARTINQVMAKVYSLIQRDEGFPRLQIIHISGKSEYHNLCKQLVTQGIKEDKIGRLIVKPYLEEMEYGLAVADLIICRAGAATLAEITARGIPAILIPYPYAAGNHQYYNALLLAKEKAAFLITEEELTPQRLYDTIREVVLNEELRRQMSCRIRRFGRPEAGEIIVRELMKVGKTTL